MNEVYILKEEWIYNQTYSELQTEILGIYSTSEHADRALTRLQRSEYFRNQIEVNDFYNAYISREALDPVNDIWLTFL